MCGDDDVDDAAANDITLYRVPACVMTCRLSSS